MMFFGSLVVRENVCGMKILYSQSLFEEEAIIQATYLLA